MWEELYYRWLRRSESVRRMGRRDREYSNLTKVLNAFTSGLRLFLGYRLEGFQFWRQQGGHYDHFQGSGWGGPQATPPGPGSVALGGAGFYIQLHCTNYHVAALASPAYALTWRNLGSFTTPANGVLPPGAWIFGAQGGLFTAEKRVLGLGWAAVHCS
jgi:hypothetical protein